MGRLTLLAAVVLATSALCPAAERFLSPDGSDENPGSRRRPWRSLAKANAALKPGDTAVLLAGTYDGQIRPDASGTGEHARITYRALPGSKVNATGGIDLKGKSYVTVDGIDVIDPDGGWGNMDEADHCIVANSTMKGGSGWTGFSISGRFSKDGKALAASHHNCFRGNTLHGQTHNDSLMIWWNAHHNLVENCRFLEAKHILVSLAGHGTASPLTPHHCIVRGNYLCNTLHTAMKTSTGAHDNLFERNVIAAANANGFQIASSREIVRFNVILRSGAKRQWTGAFGQYTNVYKGNWFAQHAPEGQNSLVQDCRFYNNTAVGNDGCAVFYSYSREGARQALVGLGGNEYVNNLFWRNGLRRGGIEIYYTGASWSYCNRMKRPDTYRGNLIGAPGATVVQFKDGLTLAQARKASGIVLTGNIQGDPGFADEKKDDHRLNAGSRCVDAGTVLTRTLAAGEGRTLKVADASFFCDGWGIVQPDTIQVGTARLRVERIVDRQTIVLAAPGRWRQGDGVSLPYTGKAPDIGAFGGTGASVRSTGGG